MTISTAESRVMEVLWRRSGLSADEVVAAVAEGQCWTAATVRTLLNRLLNKGVVTAQRDGRRYLYAAAVSREDYLARESQSFLDRLFDGRVGPMMTYFSSQRKLTPDDVAHLKMLIQELEDDA